MNKETEDKRRGRIKDILSFLESYDFHHDFIPLRISWLKERERSAEIVSAPNSQLETKNKIKFQSGKRTNWEDHQAYDPGVYSNSKSQKPRSNNDWIRSDVVGCAVQHKAASGLIASFLYTTLCCRVFRTL